MIFGSLPDGSLAKALVIGDRSDSRMSGLRRRAAGATAEPLERLGAWPLPAVFVLLFVAVKFMPGITSGTSTLNLADLALLGVTIWALVRLRRAGLGALRGSHGLWIAILALLAYLVAASLYPTFSDPDYAWKTRTSHDGGEVRRK